MFKRSKEKGFTLIELMIVIAIIGILAAIAIPNFISYRNKSFCTGVESDASSIAAAISDYFAIPSHINTPLTTQLNGGNGMTMSNNNTFDIAGTDPGSNITITVRDASGRCPDAYKMPSRGWGNTNTSSAPVFFKFIAN
jgi:prepilin-type N-terminal cleavage/methylation domain-containing protein